MNKLITAPGKYAPGAEVHGRDIRLDDLLALLRELPPDPLLDPLEDPAHRGVALLYAARCAILLADADTASKAVERLSAVVDEGSLDDLRPAATAARARTGAYSRWPPELLPAPPGSGRLHAFVNAIVPL